MIEVKKLVKEIRFIASIDFTGVINIGTIRGLILILIKNIIRKLSRAKE